MDKFWRGIRNKCWQTLHSHPEFSQVTLIQQLPGTREDLAVYVIGRREAGLAKTKLGVPIHSDP